MIGLMIIIDDGEGRVGSFRGKFSPNEVLMFRVKCHILRGGVTAGG